MSLSVGPPPLGPNDPPPCVYGLRWAIRSAPRLMVATTALAIFWVIVLAVSGALTAQFLVSPDDRVLVTVGYAVIGALGGIGLTIVLIVVWLLTALSRRYHWTQRIERLPKSSTGHSLLTLRGRHLHVFCEIVCTVSDRTGHKYVCVWRAPTGGCPPLRSGDGPIVEYPDQFDGAPWPAPGTYRVVWTVERRARAAPRILSTSKWKVSD